MTTVSSSTSVSSTTSATQSSTKVTVPSKLSTYLSNTKDDTKRLLSAIKLMYSDTDADMLDRDTKNFVKYYNNIINNNSLYSDTGLTSLTKNMNSVVDSYSTALSKLGITIKSGGGLRINSTTLKTVIGDGDFSDFLTSNESSGGFFYSIKEKATNLKKDNQYYLSSDTKLLIKNASN